MREREKEKERDEERDGRGCRRPHGVQLQRTSYRGPNSPHPQHCFGGNKAQQVVDTRTEPTATITKQIQTNPSKALTSHLPLFVTLGTPFTSTSNTGEHLSLLLEGESYTTRRLGRLNAEPSWCWPPLPAAAPPEADTWRLAG